MRVIGSERGRQLGIAGGIAGRGDFGETERGGDWGDGTREGERSGEEGGGELKGKSGEEMGREISNQGNKMRTEGESEAGRGTGRE